MHAGHVQVRGGRAWRGGGARHVAAPASVPAAQGRRHDASVRASAIRNAAQYRRRCCCRGGPSEVKFPPDVFKLENSNFWDSKWTTTTAPGQQRLHQRARGRDASDGICCAAQHGAAQKGRRAGAGDSAVRRDQAARRCSLTDCLASLALVCARRVHKAFPQARRSKGSPSACAQAQARSRPRAVQRRQEHQQKQLLASPMPPLSLQPRRRSWPQSSARRQRRLRSPQRSPQQPPRAPCATGSLPGLTATTTCWPPCPSPHATAKGRAAGPPQPAHPNQHGGGSSSNSSTSP